MSRDTLFALGGVLIGLGVGWWLWSPAPATVETYAPAIAQAPTTTSPHGSVVAERKPDANAKPKHQLPPGATAERVMQATIASPLTGCPSIVCDATLIQMDDGSRRVIFSSPDGRVQNAVDIPPVNIEPVRATPWAAGASYGTDATYGGWVDHDLGPLRLGVEIQQTDQGTVTARARVGLRF